MHRINLRGPWQLRSAEGRITLRRTFHRPTGLVGVRRLLLVWQFAGSPPDEVAINGAVVELSFRSDGVGQLGFIDILDILTASNRCELSWAGSSAFAADLPGETSITVRIDPARPHSLLLDAWLEIYPADDSESPATSS